MDGTNPSTSRHENESRPTLFRKFTAIGTARRVGRGRLAAANDLEHAFHRTNATSRRQRVRIGNHRLCVHTDPRTRLRDGVRWFFTTHEQGNCRSSGKVLNLQIMLGRFIGAISPLAKSWTTNAGLARGDNGSPCLSYGEGFRHRGPTTKALSAFAGAQKRDGWPTTKSNAMLASPMQVDLMRFQL
jgi:hypothetical protein